MSEVTPGIDLLSSILNTKSNQEFDKLNEDWFKSESSEHRLYKFIKKVLTKYSRLPTPEMCEKYGVMVSYPVGNMDSDAEEDFLVDYYTEIVNRRYTKTVASSLIQPDGLLDQFKHEIRNMLLTSDTFDDVDVVGKLHEMTTDLASKFGQNRHDQIAFTFEEEYEKFRKNQYENRFRSDDLGIMTPYEPINKVSGGWKAGEWILETGNVKAGKSWVWEYFIYYMNQFGGHPTCIASMEMPNQDARSTSGVFIRMMSLIGQLSPTLIRSGKLPDVSMDRIDKYVKKYRTETVFDNGKTAPMIFYDATKRRGLKAFERYQADNKFELSCIDSIYLAEMDDNQRYYKPLDQEKALVDARMDMIKKHGCIGFDSHQLVKTNTKETGVDSSTVAGAAAWTRNCDLAFAIRPEGDNKNLRRIEPIASRHGADFEAFVINFQLDPRPNFSVVQDYNAGGYDDGID